MPEHSASNSGELRDQIRSAVRSTRRLRFAVLAFVGILLAYPLLRSLISLIIHPHDWNAIAWLALSGLDEGDYGGLVSHSAIRFTAIGLISLFLFSLPIAACYRAWRRAGLRRRLAALSADERRVILSPLLRESPAFSETRKLIAPLLSELRREPPEVAPAARPEAIGTEIAPELDASGIPSTDGCGPSPSAAERKRSDRPHVTPSLHGAWWEEARGWVLTAATIAAILGVSEAASLRLQWAKQAEDRRTRICQAAAEGNLAEVEQLLRADSTRVRLRDRSGRTPLHYAAIQGQLKVAALLLARGADVNARDEWGWTPLLRATCEEMLAAPRARVVKFLLAHGADPAASDHDGDTPLHMAVSEADPEVVRLLLSYGAPPAAQDQLGNTPLHFAAYDSLWRDSSTTAPLLLTRDPSLIYTRNREGKTPLQIAREKGYAAAVKLLENAGRGGR